MTRKSWSMGRESDKGSYATKSKLGNMLASTVVSELNSTPWLNCWLTMRSLYWKERCVHASIPR